jgi:hypothetical protein
MGIMVIPSQVVRDKLISARDQALGRVINT